LKQGQTIKIKLNTKKKDASNDDGFGDDDSSSFSSDPKGKVTSSGDSDLLGMPSFSS
jgi:hypothetical protein